MRICRFPHKHRRREYWSAVPQYFDVSDDERSQYQRDTLHQILMDVPRTAPSSRLFLPALLRSLSPRWLGSGLGLGLGLR